MSGGQRKLCRTEVACWLPGSAGLSLHYTRTETSKLTIEVLQEVFDLVGEQFAVKCSDDGDEFYFMTVSLHLLRESFSSLGDALIALGHILNGEPRRLSELQGRRDLGYFIQIVSKVVGPFGIAYVVEYKRQSPRTFLSYVYWNGAPIQCDSTASAVDQAHALTHGERQAKVSTWNA